MKPRDAAKIGLLYLQKGRWEGKQILDEGWVRAATSRKVEIITSDLDVDFGYGYHWWTFGDGVYGAMGRGGQYIVVVEKLNMVVVLTGSSGAGSPPQYGELINTYFVGSVKSNSPLPENAEALTALQREIDGRKRPPAAKAVPPLPPRAREISGRKFVLDAKGANLRWFSLTFDGSAESMVSFMPKGEGNRGVAAGKSQRAPLLRVGLDDRYRFTPRVAGYSLDRGAFGLPAALKGYWVGNDTFVLVWDEINNINRWTMRMQFSGENVKVAISEATYLPNMEFTARMEE
jgi:hypothetical protein